MVFDLLIKNGNIVDSEKEIYKINIGIIGEKIKYIGKEKLESKKTIDAKGLFIFPGFIDTHSHADVNLLLKQPTPKIYQGVTTEVIGNCGFSFFPITTKNKFLSWTSNNRAIWGKTKINLFKAAKNIKSYFTYAENKLCSNLVSHIGYGTVRYNISGYKNRITEPEKKKIIYEMDKSLSDGACGISLGLVYSPNKYITYEEMFSIFSLVKKHKKIISVHLRDECDDVIDALQEVINFAIKTEVSLQISHFKVYGKNNQYKIYKMLEIVEWANIHTSTDIDLYPYTAGSTSLRSLLDYKKYLSIGFENIFLTNLKMSLKQAMEKENITDPLRLIKKILMENPYEGVLIFGIEEKTMEKIIKSKYCCIGSDGLYGENPHPRTYGCFIRFLKYFVKDKKILTLKEAIHKITHKPAQKLNLKSRGLIKENYYADLVIIEMNKLDDASNYSKPCEKPKGIEYIILNGNLLFEKGRFKNIFAGKVIRL